MIISQPVETYTIVLLNKVRYCFPAAVIREVSPLPEITPLAEASGATIGVVQYRRQAVSILHLAKRLGEESPGLNLTDWLLFLDIEGAIVGVIVHAIGQTTRLDFDSSPERNPGILGEKNFVAGVAIWQEKLVTLLDPAKLLDTRKEGIDLALPGIKPKDFSPTAPTDFYQRYFPRITPAQRAELETRTLALAGEIVRPDRREASKFAAFQLQAEWFGLPATYLVELIDLPHLTPVPCCPPHILGLSSTRDGIICFVDIRAALRLPVDSPAQFDRAAIVEWKTLRFGIALEGTTHLVALPTDSIQAVYEGVEFLTGIAHNGDRSFGIIDLPELCRNGNLAVDVAA